jgi:hypothetical protein
MRITIKMSTLTDSQLQAAFLAARKHGKILNDDVLRDIIAAVRETLPPWQPASGGPRAHGWFLYRGDDTPLEDRYYRKDNGQVRYFTSYENARRFADKLNAPAKGDER